MRKKKNVFRNIIKDIAHKYENINKKLLISFKNSFVKSHYAMNPETTFKRSIAKERKSV